MKLTKEAGALATFIAAHSALKNTHSAAVKAREAAGITTHDELPQGSLGRVGAEATDVLGSLVKVGDHALALGPALVMRGAVGALGVFGTAVGLEIASLMRMGLGAQWPGPLEAVFTPPGNLITIAAAEALVVGATAVSMGKRIHKSWKNHIKPELQNFAQQTMDTSDSAAAAIQNGKNRARKLFGRK